jgi:hydrogenase maturation protein HypF
MATRFKLSGWVQNTNENVEIEVSGTAQNISKFLKNLGNAAPPAALIEEITLHETAAIHCSGFSIHDSHDISDEITEISPDIAVCKKCLEDMDQPGTRLEYPFVNCTNCGPRFTIISDLPYDRVKTTMRPFVMCPECNEEYRDISNRRFHAQPTACTRCGPQYELYGGRTRVSQNIGTIIAHVSQSIENGNIVLIKGLGGMHLACDAFCERAVRKLREIKNREGKPFAVMFGEVEELRNYVHLSAGEEQSLVSWRRPIVLLRKKPDSGLPRLADQLNAGLSILGVMLPYMPFHHLLFRHLKTKAIVLTSGNFSSEPILIENGDAIDKFSPFVNDLVLHNRDIFNRTDDSVVRMMGGQERMLRRSRGYVPAPVRTQLNTEGIVAFGAELTNCFCVGKGNKAFLSQHIGDLRTLETTLFYEQTIAQFIQLFRITPALLAVDLHPDYISTRTGLNYSGLPVVRVQHHHAHIASCMAEHRLDEPVVGIALDGTGYGSDGYSWGAEFMICDLNDFERITHFDYVAQPGGDLAAEEPWRMAVSWLYKVFGRHFIDLDLPLFKEIEPEKIPVILNMIDKKINCPLTSSAGRLFDCVASLLGLVQIATFHAEGPMLLESLVRDDLTESYPFDYERNYCFNKTIHCIVEDIGRGIDNSIISTKFHNTIILIIFDFANTVRLTKGLNKVVLSGGVFQNRYLLEGAVKILQKNNFEVYTHAAVPANDGGIALGQLAVASKRRELKCV